MSSPRLNNLIIVGCIMAYVSVLLFGLDGKWITSKAFGDICVVCDMSCFKVRCYSYSWDERKQVSVVQINECFVGRIVTLKPDSHVEGKKRVKVSVQ